jgi:hypothetical protein
MLDPLQPPFKFSIVNTLRSSSANIGDMAALAGVGVRSVFLSRRKCNPEALWQKL